MFPRLFAACILCALCGLSVREARGQLEQGSVTGVVTDPSGARIVGASVQLRARTGSARSAQSSAAGEFSFAGLAYGDYALEVHAAGFAGVAQPVQVRSNLPVRVLVRLHLGASEQIEVSTAAENRASTEVALGAQALTLQPAANSPLGVTRLLAAMPGWTAEDNGLVHVRGIDDGVLYVADGVPVPDRMDRFSSSPFAADDFQSLQVLTGGVPAEFGGRSGAVVVMQSRAAPDGAGDHRWSAAGEFGGGSFDQRSVDLSGTAQLGELNVFAGGEGLASERFIDPVSARNLHNHGGNARAYTRADWRHAADSVMLTASGGLSRFTVPNNALQEAAGQDQRQDLSDSRLSLAWQRTWSPLSVSDAVVYGQWFRADLRGSANDVPLFAQADRRHSRTGASFALTHAFRRNLLKMGISGERIHPRESLLFAVTDPALAAEVDISAPARQFTPQEPFHFAQQAVGSTQAAYAQDSLSLGAMTVQAGVRFERSTLPLSEHQFSPRVAWAYTYARTGTTLRASYGRFFMPPQIENLLLAGSPQARQLSPFAAQGGGTRVRAERSSLSEAGFSQRLPLRMRLEAAVWYRRITNVDDPNVFFNTTIIFPNSVARGIARGFDASLQLPEFHGWSGFANFTHGSIREYGPLNGGLFLTDDFASILPGQAFRPDHDIRTSLSTGVIKQTHLHGFWGSALLRHQSGTPLEVRDTALADLLTAWGASLVDFSAQRTLPFTVVDAAAGVDLYRLKNVDTQLRFEVLNLLDQAYVFNFGNPFSGTHFGSPRSFAIGLRFAAAAGR